MKEVLFLIMLLVAFSIFIVKEKKKAKAIKEELKESIDYVENNLSSEDYTEVVPINARSYRYFITEELPKVAEFYAFKEEKTVKIYLHFRYEPRERHFEEISKELFAKYYKIKSRKT